MKHRWSSWNRVVRNEMPSFEKVCVLCGIRYVHTYATDGLKYIHEGEVRTRLKSRDRMPECKGKK